MSLELVKEALDNNWEDRIFMHYRELVDPHAVRPQDNKSQEWLDIVKSLKLKVEVVADDKEQVKSKVKKDDITTSSRD